MDQNILLRVFTTSVVELLDISATMAILLWTSTEVVTSDAEMNRLQQKGLGSKKRQAEPITDEEEELLWSKGMLGEKSPHILLTTMVYMIGLYFALRSGKEHRELRFSPSQMELVEGEGEWPYLLYTEDVKKSPQWIEGTQNTT